MSAVALVQFSSVDIGKLLPLGRQALDRNLAESADSAGHGPPLHHMLIVAAMKDAGARSATDITPYLNLFHAGFLIAADDYHWAEILELAGMPGLLVESTQRGLSLGFIAGTLTQWQAAILRGCQREVSTDACGTYNRIYTEFKNIGIAAAFRLKSKPNNQNGTFLLEYSP
jgi:hypothetical protein